jgi:3-isopropylmalate/(R)-2-methylmalate dehydratase small subunit
MEPLSIVSSTVAPLDKMNVDTDQIIPKQFLKRIERTGFGEFLFYDWRYSDDGSINPEFVLNRERYKGAKILLTRDNFGSGSSREHAPWALREYGFEVIIAPSFADIFYNNCFKNAILPITLHKSTVDELFSKVHSKNDYSLTVDLERQTITDDEGWVINFEIDTFKKRALLEGLDDIAHTLQHEERIVVYEQKMWHERKWAFPQIDT